MRLPHFLRTIEAPSLRLHHLESLVKKALQEGIPLPDMIVPARHVLFLALPPSRMAVDQLSMGDRSSFALGGRVVKPSFRLSLRQPPD